MFQTFLRNCWNFGVTGAHEGLKNPRTLIRFQEVPLIKTLTANYSIIIGNDVVVGSNPTRSSNGSVAQLVEHEYSK